MKEERDIVRLKIEKDVNASEPMSCVYIDGAVWDPLETQKIWNMVRVIATVQIANHVDFMTEIRKEIVSYTKSGSEDSSVGRTNFIYEDSSHRKLIAVEMFGEGGSGVMTCFAKLRIEGTLP